MSFKDTEIKEYKLEEICEIKQGLHFKKDNCSRSGIPIIKVRNIGSNNLIEIDKLCDHWNKEIQKHFTFIEYGDIVIARTGSAGRVGINLLDQTFLHDSHVVKIVPKLQLCHKKYLYHFLLSQEEELKGLSKGGIVPGIRVSDLRNFGILIPSIKIQERISKILDSFVSLEQELEQRNQQYEYYRNLLIGEPIKIYKNIEIKEYLLGDICEIKKGISFKEKDYIRQEDICKYNSSEIMPVLKVKNVQGGKVQIENLVYCRFQEIWKNITTNLEDTVIVNFSSGKSGVGRIGINLTNLQLVPNQHLFIFRPKVPFLNKKYFYYCLENKEYDIKDLISSGNIPVLSKGSLQKLKLCIPPLEVQKDIVKKLDKFSDLLNIEGALKEEILSRKAQYESYRNLLFKKYCND